MEFTIPKGVKAVVDNIAEQEITLPPGYGIRIDEIIEDNDIIGSVFGQPHRRLRGIVRGTLVEVDGDPRRLL